MNSAVVKIYVTCVLIIFSVFQINAQTAGDYRSALSGAWNNLATWETFDGISWVAPSMAPSDSNGIITIRSAHVVNVTTTVWADQILIESGASLTPSSYLVVLDGPGVDMECHGVINLSLQFGGSGTTIIDSGAILNWNGGIMLGSGTTTIQSGATCNILTNTQKYLDNTFALINYGIVNWSAGNVGLLTTSRIDNYGTLNIGTNVGVSTSYSGGFGILNNKSSGVINKNGSGNTQLSALFNVTFNNSGTVNINSGSILLNGNGSHNGIYRILSGTLTGTVAMNYSGPEILNNDFISLSGLNFTGTAPQQLNGTGIITTLTLNGSGGIILGGTQTINNSLTLTNGKLLLGNNDIIMGSNATLTGGNSNSYLITNGTGSLKRRVNNNQTDVLFPVGTAAKYLPAKIQLTAASVTDDFKVRVTDDLYASYNLNGEPTDSRVFSAVVNHSWLITETVDGGSDAQITLQWNASDESANFNRNTSSIGHYSNNGWSLFPATAATGSGPYVLTQSGVTTFSPFGVINQFVSLSDALNVCSGSGFDIPFSAVGTFNAGNIFQAELSDSSGDFQSSTIIGTDSSVLSGTIAALLPGFVSQGNNYKVRIVSTDPASAGNEGGILLNNSYNIAENVSVCLGETYYFADGDSASSATIHTSRFNTVAGCDSSITTTLSVNAYNFSESVSICKGETHFFPDGDTTTISRVHISNLTAMDGCDSMIETSLTVNEVDASAQLSGNTITATANVSGASYQWLDCNSAFAPISTETGQSITTFAGSYAVEVTKNSCADTSSCFTILAVGGAEQKLTEIFHIHPNPVHDVLNIFSGMQNPDFSISIFNLQGKEMLSGFSTSTQVAVKMQHLPTGIYFLKLNTGERQAIFKVMKD